MTAALKRMNRIGLGTDTHALISGRKLLIGGIHIPSDKGAVGHSDADVLIHAICDALLGAAALGDIGTHFPDTDPALKNADSSLILKHITEMLQNSGYNIINIDCSISLEKPKLQPYMNEIRTSLAKIMSIDMEMISVKAKTSEKMGFIGRGEGVSAIAIVLIESK